MYNVYEHKSFEDSLISASFESSPWKIARIFNFSLQLIWENGPIVGSGKVQVSDDQINWSDIPNSDLPISGASDNNIWSMRDIHHNWVRLVFTHTSGSASMTLIESGKGW